jgi:zinc D-Ala-D-Ala carboxypeptidase
MTDKLFGHKTDIADIYGFEKYSVDLELLRTNPELSTRKLLTTVTDVIGTTTHYKSYGMVMDVIDTTKPQTAINQYLKDNTTVTAGSFREYRVQLFDRNPVRLKTAMQNCNDVLRGITLKVCSVSSQLDASVLQPGMLVLVDYTDSTGRDGTIVEVLGNLPSVVSEDTTEYDAKVPFQNEPCPDTSNVKPNSDPVNDSANPTKNTSAPTPAFNSPSCKPPQESIEDAQPSDPNSQFSKYFKLKDLTKTNTGLPNNPNADEKERLGYLARDVLDVLVDKYGKNSFTINSAFRSEKVNKAVKGSATSQHRWGQAADITFTRLYKDQDIFDRFEEIVASDIPYDQIIFESNGPGSVWFHISIAVDDNITPFKRRRKEVRMHGPWTATKDPKGTYPKYERATLDLRAKINKYTELA